MLEEKENKKTEELEQLSSKEEEKKSNSENIFSKENNFLGKEEENLDSIRW